MANKEHLAILRQGVEVWNQWKRDNPNIFPDLSKADLRGADLRRANLIRVDFRRADLHEANLLRVNVSEANLMGADLRWTNLSGAYLRWTYLNGAKLNGAKLSGANLYWARLNGANLGSADLSRANLGWTDLSGVFLSEADFEGAILSGTLLTNVNLSEVKGLDTVNHWGPSTIGIDTLYRSQGKIPESFLRGAGVPEAFIEYIPQLISGNAIQFYSCFISYSTIDQEFAERLHADLQSKGVRCWFAPEDIKGGRKLHEQIPEAIRLYDKLLLVLSEDSMRSKWVKTEIYHARQNEVRDNCRKLFPINLVEFGKIKAWEAFDADSGKDMGRKIREYFIPDSSNWKEHDAYMKAFERLMKDLNLDEIGQR